MSKLQILLLIACVSVLLTACAQHAQARPGPSPFVLVNPSSAAKDVHPENTEVKNSDVTDTPINAVTSEESKEVDSEHADVKVDTVPSVSSEESEKAESEDDHEIVCAENGDCMEKRLLTATIDYKNDGPNNPITDPPH